jgi:segregation and condensation protein A
MEEIFKIKVGEFEGPLDLLLDLIEKRKLHVSDVSLAQVADDFINYVKALQEYSIPGVAHFVLVASTLLLIKSRNLLPTLELSEEENADAQDLERRLKMYQRMREVSRHLKERFGKNIIFERGDRKFIEPVFSPEESITLPNLLGALRRAIESIPIKEFVPKAIVQKVISLEDMIGRLTDRIQTSLKLSFKEFAKSHEQKVEVIVGFLAMLELVKQGAIDVVQHKRFDDIHMEAQDAVSVPRYE